MRTMKLRRTSALAAAVALALTACGGDGGDADPGDTGTEATGTEDGGGDGDVTTDVGVTAEPCPNAVNPDNGCIYLGVISDLTEGPFAALAVPITDAQKAFWNRVNENGGIGGAYDVDITTYTRDNKYNPEIHNQVYQEIKPNILALAQTLGSPTTAAILDDLKASSIVAAPASWTSAWDFEDVIVESGNNYCVESINALDFLNAEAEISSVLAVHYPGDYGADGAAGAKLWADANGVDFASVEQAPGGQPVDAAVGAILQQQPDVVVVTTAPTELAQIVGGAAAQGFTGRFLGNSPTWNPALLQSPAADALTSLYTNGGPWPSFGTDTPGHTAMREALGDVNGNDGYTSGWAWSYPLLAALEAAYDSGDLTRAGVLAAVSTLDSVDYEGMLPAEAGNFTGDPADQFTKVTAIGRPDAEVGSGLTTVETAFTGDTLAGITFDGPCFQTVSLD